MRKNMRRAGKSVQLDTWRFACDQFTEILLMRQKISFKCDLLPKVNAHLA